MIGYESGGGGGGSSRPDAMRTWERVRDDAIDLFEDVRDVIWRWVERVTEIVLWVRVLVERLEGIAMERWQTRDDERTCPQCGGLDGQIWAWNEGEFPPAHTNCRCSRVCARTEWSSRTESVWQRQTRRVVAGGWQLTGWA